MSTIDITPNTEGLIRWGRYVWRTESNKESDRARAAQAILAECGVYVSRPVRMEKKVSLAKRQPLPEFEHTLYVQIGLKRNDPDALVLAFAERQHGPIKGWPMDDSEDRWAYSMSTNELLAQNSLDGLKQAISDRMVVAGV